MKVSYLDGAKNLILSTAPKPRIKDNEVLIKVKSVGICGSDLLYYRTGGTKKRPINRPFILGHEVSGIVEKRGKSVKDIKIGDRVAVEPGKTCGKCYYCKSGHYNLCMNVKFLATPPVDGAFVEYLAHNADLVYKIPDKISFDEGALIEPASVAYYAIYKSNLKMARSVIILGAGPIGLLMLQIAKLSGAFPIFMLDIDDFRLNMAKTFGADRIINIQDRDIESVLKDHDLEGKFDFVFECTGSEKVISNSVFFVKKAGVLSFIGIYDSNVPIRTKEVIDKEINILGSYRYSNTYQDIIKLIDRGMLKVQPLITHIFKLDEIKKAFEIADKRTENYLKMVIRVN
jgi:L-iditol 2-dehydrogenase